MKSNFLLYQGTYDDLDILALEGIYSNPSWATETISLLSAFTFQTGAGPQLKITLSQIIGKLNDVPET